MVLIHVFYQLNFTSMVIAFPNIIRFTIPERELIYFPTVLTPNPIIMFIKNILCPPSDLDF